MAVWLGHQPSPVRRGNSALLSARRSWPCRGRRRRLDRQVIAPRARYARDPIKFSAPPALNHSICFAVSECFPANLLSVLSA